MSEATHLYAVAIGSNRRHIRFGRPAGVVAAAIAELDRLFALFDASPIVLNKAVGGAGRDFANAVALVESVHAPAAMLAELKAIERRFGRRPGRRWGMRVLDLDLIAWDGGRLVSRSLTIPHPRLAERNFVLGPMRAIAPHWPILGALTAEHLHSRLGKRRPAS
ncbi:2-amino-4-hydroxy-6-hydroxymethyldihydropteridine diphosphokinase [Sphingomonas xanthus]|uniref:2-amino-4-hydroxy-6-hydroxymethyldihydropteridine pyrophosphokinase n=1 Tax=Sphingomonas xanthus TaxID=2594473 RepID=A0A516ITH1_9SPHN|nr:2-amino-4-hydroxy-6-hydroxymethyldihydropteridine diphosphokinase [Sphingomonas xanthus]QDP20185.1 2-amino-4-hydroxy-6-hydroxymethyldihydropteridine diphosphokinase [Sphingomonas xanthus]